MERPEKDVGKIYKILKKGGHDLSKLVSAVNDPAIGSGLRNRFKGFNPPGVHIRYGFEMMILAGDDLFGSARSPKLDEAKLDEAFELAKEMVDLANGLHAKKFPVALQWTDGDNPKKVIERIRQAVPPLRAGAGTRFRGYPAPWPQGKDRWCSLCASFPSSRLDNGQNCDFDRLAKIWPGIHHPSQRTPILGGNMADLENLT